MYETISAYYILTLQYHTHLHTIRARLKAMKALSIFSSQSIDEHLLRSYEARLAFRRIHRPQKRRKDKEMKLHTRSESTAKH